MRYFWWWLVLGWSLPLWAQEAPKVLFALERTTCYGKCPYYSVQIFDNGTARYHGKRDVERLGVYEANVPKAIVQQLSAKAKAIQYDQLHPKYPIEGLGIIDFPLCISTVASAVGSKTIYNRNDAPLGLVEYERLFDALTADLDWRPAR